MVKKTKNIVKIKRILRKKDKMNKLLKKNL